ncbi:MAG: hypothetical protein ACTSRP_12450 [Candidatus Helarchaeota archaeon]
MTRKQYIGLPRVKEILLKNKRTPPVSKESVKKLNLFIDSFITKILLEADNFRREVNPRKRLSVGDIEYGHKKYIRGE